MANIKAIILSGILAAGAVAGTAQLANAASAPSPAPTSSTTAPCADCDNWATHAKVTKADAEKTALAAHPGGKVVQAEAFPWDENTVAWDVVVAAGGTEHWVTVHGDNGKVLDDHKIECPTDADVTTLDVPCDK
ncbi:hypothetical protein J2S49_001674 [Arcanobacterium wilhelmae]|uniref:PepSY domain-containing protein n=1 Tax=Arcanobacterium wilhelmae TaxID=1803177 RepID=A0ABT9ND31_9ACTO|nr:PepSY domain-containing protein [Arcanobacterium wilhelmae]MDP9801598.1 hypothetical protein [Arcanobacterium wilhelmae]WFN90921.1 PepSY domain-containing protein [Arcanobacterium wilhelmae]